MPLGDQTMPPKHLVRQDLKSQNLMKTYYWDLRMHLARHLLNLHLCLQGGQIIGMALQHLARHLPNLHLLSHNLQHLARHLLDLHLLSHNLQHLARHLQGGPLPAKTLHSDWRTCQTSSSSLPMAS